MYFRYFLADDEQNGLNWFLLSQTFNQKEKVIVTTHEGSYVCEVMIANFNTKILKTVKCLGFLTLKFFTKVATFTASGGF